MAEYLLGLKNIFKVQGLRTADKPGDGAHEAAYLAHFIQGMTGWKRSEVEDYLTTNELEMEVGESASPAPDPDEEDTVKSQKPLPRAIVAPGDKISVSLYDRYMTKVLNVTKPPLRQHEAVKIIQDCSLEVEEPIGKIEVKPSIPEGVAVEQDAKPDTLVLPGSKVRIRISVHKKPAQLAPENTPVTTWEEFIPKPAKCGSTTTLFWLSREIKRKSGAESPGFAQSASEQSLNLGAG